MRLRYFFTLLVVASLFSLPGCSADNAVEAISLTSDLNTMGAGSEVVFQYTAYNRGGDPIVRGYLRLTRADSTRVVGRWQLRALVDTIHIGPQHGYGTLVGVLHEGGGLHVNLNPHYVDNNVILSGRFHRNVYSGRWEWIGFPGVLNSGTFQAVRVDRSLTNVE